MGKWSRFNISSVVLGFALSRVAKSGLGTGGEGRDTSVGTTEAGGMGGLP